MVNEHRPFTEEYQKELISRAQFDEQLLRFGWLPHHISRDLGEDFLVHIYDKGRRSGLSFYVQLKGTDDLEKYKLKTEDYVSYSVDVQHILRWEETTELVIFVLWDIQKRVGLWDTIQRVVPILDEQNTAWREQKSVNIRLPFGRDMSHIGLEELRRLVAEHTYPIKARGRFLDLEVTLRIPNTPRGQEFLKQLEQFYARGGEVTIPPEFIAELATSDWHQRLFGKVVFSSEHPIFVASRKADISTLHRLDAVSPDGEHAILPLVDLRVIRRGNEEATLSNQHQNLPLQFALTFQLLTRQLDMAVELVNPGPNVQDTLDAVRFLRVVGKPGSRIILKTHGSPLPPVVLDSPTIMRYSGVNAEFETLVEKLCRIQYKTGVMFALEEFKLEPNDVRAIEEVYTIVTTGKLRLEGVDTSPMMSKELVEIALEAKKTGRMMRFSTKGAKTQKDILGSDVPLGLADWEVFAAGPKSTEEELEILLSEMSTGESREVDLTVYDGVAEFSQWLN